VLQLLQIIVDDEIQLAQLQLYDENVTLCL